MYPNFNYYPQQQSPVSNQQQTQMQPNYLRPQVQSGLKGRPVSSIEEARASTIDFDGSIFFFPDLANRRIYTKQINMDGTSTLNMYELRDVPAEQPIVNLDFVTRSELEAALQELKMSLIPVKEQVPQVVEKPAVRPEVLSF